MKVTDEEERGARLQSQRRAWKQRVAWSSAAGSYPERPWFRASPAWLHGPLTEGGRERGRGRDSHPGPNRPAWAAGIRRRGDGAGWERGGEPGAWVCRAVAGKARDGATGTAVAALSQPLSRTGRPAGQTLPPGAKGELLPTSAHLPGQCHEAGHPQGSTSFRTHSEDLPGHPTSSSTPSLENLCHCPSHTPLSSCLWRMSVRSCLPLGRST